MSAYTIVNLKDDVEDTAGQRVPGIEGRFARSSIDSEHLGLSYFRYPADRKAENAHSHREQEEVYLVLSGSGRMLLGEEVREIRQWDVIRVAPATPRAFHTGPEGLELVVVGSDRPEGGDGESGPAVWPD